MEVVWEVVGERSGDAARHGASAEGSAEGGRGTLARGRPDSESAATFRRRPPPKTCAKSQVALCTGGGENLFCLLRIFVKSFLSTNHSVAPVAYMREYEIFFLLFAIS